MLETYNTVLINASRNLKKNIENTPLLYFLFTIMIIFSMGMMAMLTLFFINNNVEIELNDVFFIIFFMFLMKSSYDFYRYFNKSNPVTYSLSTPVTQFKTVFEIFLVIFWIQLGIWVLFSTIYHISLIGIGISLNLEITYIQFTLGVILSTIIGPIIAIHFFSKKKYRLIPIPIIIATLYYFNDLISILIILGISFIYLLWSLTNILDCYQYVNRKQRKEEKLQVWINNIKKTVFYKETIILYRDRLLFSIIFTAISLGVISGYLAGFDNNSIFPESIQLLTDRLTFSAYAFVGIYILTIYTSVFISLSFFLNEEKTLWLIHHLPIKTKKIVQAKFYSLLLPVICSIPFIAYFTALTTAKSFDFVIWFFIFSFLAGVIITFPLGAKYVGKKSDILLLYSISLLMFIILSVGFSIQSLIQNNYQKLLLFYTISIILEIILLFVSIEISSGILVIRYKKNTYIQ